MKRIISSLICRALIFCMASFLLAAFKRVLPAAAEGLNMAVSYGIEDTARYGRSMLVYVELEGASYDMSGEVTIILARSGNKNNIRYSREVFLPAEEAVSIAVPVDLYSNYSDMLVVFLNSDSSIRLEQEIQLNVNNYQKYILCGILTDNHEKSFYQDFGSSYVYLDEYNIPEDYRGIDMLDIIIIEEYDVSSLSKKQQEALGTWLYNGGTLILSPRMEIGEYINNEKVISEKELYFGLNEDAQLLYKLRSAIESYERECIANTAYNEGILEEAEDPLLYYRYIGSEMISSTVIEEDNIKPLYRSIHEIKPQKGRVLLSDSGDVILYGKGAGSGMVIYSAVDVLKTDMDRASAKSTAAEAYFCYVIINSISEIARLKLESEYSGFKFNNSWSVDVLTRPDEQEVLTAGEMGIIIALYLSLAVPGVFIILKRLSLSKYIWAAVPLISIAFTAFMYAYSSQTRVKETYFGYLDVRYFDNNVQEAYGSLDFVIGLNSNNAFNFSLPNTVKLSYSYDWIDGYFNNSYNNTRGKYRVPIDFGVQETQIEYMEEGLEVTIDNIPAFQDVFYNADYKLEYELIADGTVIIKEDAVKGTVKNNSSKLIKDAFIIADTLYIPIGDIDGGEEVTVTEEGAVALISTELAGYIKKYTSEEYASMPAKELRKRTSIQMAMKEKIGDNECCLIGFYEEPDTENPLYDVCRTDKSFGTTVVVITLTAAEGISEEEIFVSNIDTYMSSLIDGSEYNDARYMTSKNFTACYAFPEGERITKLIFSDMMNNIPEDSYYGMAGEVYLYNTCTDEYDMIFDLTDDEGIRSIDEAGLADYVNDDNSIIIMYINTSTQSLCFLPVISCYMANNYAASLN